MPDTKIVVYTAILGDYDTPLELPPEIAKRVIPIMYTDQAFKMKTWEVVRVQPMYPKDPSRSSRFYKMMPHMLFRGKSPYSLWINGNMTLVSDPTPLISWLSSYEFKWLAYKPAKAVPKTDAYDEIIHCIKLKKDDPVTLALQGMAYREEGLPKDSGLWSGGVIFRAHNDEDVIHANELWWQQIKKYSRRDQVSLPYVFWKINRTPGLFPTRREADLLVKMPNKHKK